MRILRRTVEVVIGIPDDLPTPSDDDIDNSMAVVFDVLSKEEFDTLDEHPTWDFLSARVKRKG